MASGPLITIWNQQKPKIVFVSAALPLLSIFVASIASYSFPTKEILILQLSAVVISYQLTFLIALVYDTMTMISEKTAKRITRIRSHGDFWESKTGQRYDFIYINALNGKSFFEMLSTHNIYVGEVRVIVPSNSAIQAYYESDTVVDDKNQAANILRISINNIKNHLTNLQIMNQSVKINVKHLGVFPLDFYCVFDERYCMTGKYAKDSSKRHTIGLKDIAWVEDDPQIIHHRAQHFEELWGPST